MPTTISPYALIDLATVKTLLGIAPINTDQDDKLTIFINGASSWIEKYCDRVLKQRAGIQENRNGNSSDNLLLRQWPVTAVTSLWIDPDRSFGSASLVDPAQYEISDDGAAISFFDGSFPSGRKNVRIVYTAGYSTVPDDLVQAAFWLTNWLYQFNSRGDIGKSSKGKGDENVLILQNMPDLIMSIIDSYRRTEFPDADSPGGGGWAL